MTKNTRLVTVVGGSGFIGSYVVRQLAREGYTVRVLCRDPQGAGSLRVLGDVGQVVAEYLDLARPGDLGSRLAGSHAVVNLVGVLFERGGQKFQALHSRGAATLAEAAWEAGAERFIQFSALGVDRAARSRYAASKLEGEAAVLSAFPDATILRPSVVFGREDHFFNQFAAMARSGFLPLIGGGRTRFQPVYVADLATAVSHALTRDDTRGKIYELGGPERLSMRGIYDFIARTTKRHLHYIDIPFALAAPLGKVAELLPTPPLTGDQVRLLRYDSVVGDGALTLRDLGIEPTAIELVVPEYLDRFRSRRPEAEAL